MAVSISALSVLHLMLLSAFVGITSVSMLAALISRLRICRAHFTWQGGHRLGGFPILPAAFTVATLAGLIYAYTQGYSVRPSTIIGYPAGGVFWFLATWFSRSIVITEYGIIHDVNRISQAIAWSRIADYFVTARSGKTHYVFFYADDEGRRQRLDLSVPAAHADGFHDLVRRKLDTRFSFSTKRIYGEEALDE